MSQFMSSVVTAAGMPVAPVFRGCLAQATWGIVRSQTKIGHGWASLTRLWD
jgi:hypothetical protein